MVESSLLPIVCIVALCTVCRELLRNMVWCFVVVRLVTAYAFRRCRSCVPDVALGTLFSRVAAGKGKSRSGRVVELGWNPAGWRVAGFALR